MKVEDMLEIIDSDFYVGVPDSQLKELCNYLMSHKQLGENHIIAANEGNCVGIAAGYHLATGKIPVVYMQNSGIGNIVNPLTSLLHPKVYGIPCVFIIGWRGEPGQKDEPQHIFQGEITQKLLNDLEITNYIITKDMTKQQFSLVMNDGNKFLKQGKSIAFLVKKGAFEAREETKYFNKNTLSREEVIEKIVDVAGEDIIVSTTGKASRELFEIREKHSQGHQRDFLTVGSMGHSSSIALGIAKQKKNQKVWCIDGDGAMLMHMGAIAVIGNMKPNNLIHIIINNEAHETVGGMPTVVGSIDVLSIASGCGYTNVVQVTSAEDLETVLMKAKQSQNLTLVEIKCNIFSRKDLGRPTTTAKENKENFMGFLKDNVC